MSATPCDTGCPTCTLDGHAAVDFRFFEQYFASFDNGVDDSNVNVDVRASAGGYDGQAVRGTLVSKSIYIEPVVYSFTDDVNSTAAKAIYDTISKYQGSILSSNTRWLFMGATGGLSGMSGDPAVIPSYQITFYYAYSNRKELAQIGGAGAGSVAVGGDVGNVSLSTPWDIVEPVYVQKLDDTTKTLQPYPVGYRLYIPYAQTDWKGEITADADLTALPFSLRV